MVKPIAAVADSITVTGPGAIPCALGAGFKVAVVAGGEWAILNTTTSVLSEVIVSSWTLKGAKPLPGSGVAVRL